MTVGERIKQRRIELGLSQDELAKRMGYSGKTTISKAENWGNEITTTKVKKFADALGVSFEFLMGWDDDKEFVADAPEFDDIHIELVEIAGKLSKESVDSLTKYAKYLLDSEKN